MCFLQGCCVGQGTFSEITNSGLDVQSFISLPESDDDDSIIETDDIDVEENEKDISSQTTAVKSMV